MNWKENMKKIRDMHRTTGLLREPFERRFLFRSFFLTEAVLYDKIPS